jgi:polysaccharide biosynthesis transport protein
MNRVSDAMRRAGMLSDEQTAAPGDDTPFRAGEDPADDSEFYVAAEGPASEGPNWQRGSTHSVKALVKRNAVIPIELPRRARGDDLQIIDLIRMLNRSRWLMAAVVAASVAAALAYNRLATPFYEARARVLVEPNSQDVTPFRVSTEDQGRVDYFVTQFEVLRSRSLARTTLERLHLLNADPAIQSSQVNQFLANLTVLPVRSDMGESRVISLTMQSTDPERAVRFVNGLAQAYVEQNLDTRRQGSHDAAESLNQRLAELRRAANTSEEALQRYREKKDSVALGDQQNIVVQKLAQLNASATSARMERLDKQAVYQQLMAIQQSGSPLDTFSPILTNSFIQGLKAELAALRKERVQLAERLGNLHPDIIKVDTAIANAERRLNDEMVKIVEGIRNDYEAAQDKERKITNALEEQKREVLSLNQKSIEFGQLQRDAVSTQQMFDAVRQRVKETDLAGDLQSNNARILDAAEMPRRPVWPRAELNLLIAFMAGGFLAVGLAFGVEYANPHIAGANDVVQTLGLPLLGVAPKVPSWKNRPVSLDTLPPAFQEALRSIRTRIFLSPIAATRSMAVTSSIAGEGKTIVSSNLAVSLARSGRRVLLVDADLRRPQLHSMFNLPRSPGLSEVLMGTVKVSAALVELPVPGLFVLPAGVSVASPTDLLDNERLRVLIEGFSQFFDIVVLDSPPVMAVADAAIIANAASSVLFVVGSGTTSRTTAQVAIDRLTAVQAQVVGVVLNKAKDPGSFYDPY